MIKSSVLNISTVGVGGLMSVESGRLDSLIITIVYLVLVEIVKYLKARNPQNKNLQSLDTIQKTNKISNLFQKIFKNANRNKQ